jgi:hypothetical protein
MNEDPSKAPSQTGNIVASLLKAPENVAEVIANRRTPLATGVTLLGAAAVFHAVFGLAMGLFGGWSVAIMDVAKIPLVAVCSLLLCYPSLYVFSCVGGTPLSLSQTFLLGASCLAMLGLLLVGLAPVAWLFSVSTESLPFVTMLALFIWLIAASFAVRYIGKLQAHALFKKAGGIKLWFFVLVLVTVQMVTCMRPILTAPETDGWWTGKKMFFLQHFGSTFETKK